MAHSIGAQKVKCTRTPKQYIKSIQYFEITIATSATTGTYTLPLAVDTRKAWIWFAGITVTGGTGSDTTRARADLTNSTTVTATRGASSASFTTTVRGYVIEGTPALISSIQQGTLSIAATDTTGTATINAVDTTRSAVFYNGTTSNNSTSTQGNFECSLVQTNSTTVTGDRNGTTGTMTVAFTVVEFALGVVKSVQQRSVTLTSSSQTPTDTITAVTVANTALLYNGLISTLSTEDDIYFYLSLTNGTTVTLTRTGNSTGSKTVKYTVLEFAAGVISVILRGSTAVASASSATTSANTVNTAKALLNWTNYSTTASNPNEYYAAGKLKDAATVEAYKNTGGSTTSTVGWEIVEFV